MKVIILLGLLAVATAVDYQEEWETWKAKAGRVYHSVEEEMKRLTIWISNKKYVEQHNARADEHGFTLAMNKFADLDLEEFSSMHKGFQPPEAGDMKGKMLVHNVSGMKLPDALDWREKGYVTPVKDQEDCGSCWIFSAIGSLEGQQFNASGELVSLSEQNIMDCLPGARCDKGGNLIKAFKFIEQEGGVDTEDSYPYESQDGPCRFSRDNIGAKISDYVVVSNGSEHALQDAVANVGPISVCIDANHKSFQHYDGGVYYEPACTSKTDHCVLVVGYGTSSSDFWIVKNSWGADWGNNGYLLMSRNHNNNCAIADYGTYPVVSK